VFAVVLVSAVLAAGWPVAGQQRDEALASIAVTPTTSPPPDPSGGLLSPVRAWTLDLGPAPLLGMAVRDRLLFASTADGKVHAVDALDGNLKWSALLGGRPLHPFPTPDHLIVSGDSLYALDYKDGRQAWAHPKDGSVYSPVFFRSDTVFVSKNDRMMAVAPGNGSVNWVSDPLGSDLQAPSSAECCTIGVYVSGASGLFGREMSSGKEMWKYAIPGKVYRGPLAIASRLIFGADDLGNFRAISENNGTLYSSASLGAASTVAPVALGNRILFPLDDSTLAKWSMSEMKEQWRSPLGSKPTTSPVPLYDDIWLGTEGGLLLGLRDSDGSVGHSIDLGAPADGRLASFYGMVVATSGTVLSAYDAIPLDFRATSLAQNQSVSAPKVRFAGAAFDDFFLRDVEVSNGSGWSRAKTTFTKVGYAYRVDWESEMDLSPGWNTLKARTVGDAGQEPVYREIEIRVFLDEEAPALNILSPPDGFVTSNRSVMLEGTASDSNGLEAVEGSTDFGTWVSATGLENWSVELPLVGGTYDATVRARDLSGRVSVKSIRVTSTLPGPDATPPSLWLEDNRSTVYLSSPESQVRGAASDDIDLRRVEVLAAGGWQRCAGTWKFSCPATLQEGSNLVAVKAIDTSGNAATAEIVAVLDLLPPVHSVSYPPPASHTNRAEVAIRGNTSDGSGVREIRIDSGARTSAFLPSGSEWAATWTLEPGRNVVHVNASDLAGNVATVELNLTLDTTAPKVSIDLVRPRDGEVKLFGTASDENEVAKVQASGDGGATWVEATGRESWFASVPGNPSMVVVRALDLAGNEGREEAVVPGAGFADPAGLGVVGAMGAVLALGLLLAFRRDRRRPRGRTKARARLEAESSPSAGRRQA
jgi:outer membrane protein assembly factor BamB